MTLAQLNENFIQPVVIIGAPRSGTNMLRDILVRIPNFGTWPCDEINYIWRHGNAHCSSDEFGVALATESVKKYIRQAFDRIARKRRISYVVEKTCANSLRVGFVEKVIPKAKFVFLYRDGRDAVASAMKRWVGPSDIPYLMRKARYVPVTDIPYYASRYFINRLQKIFSNEKGLSFWGPRFEGMEEMVHSKSLLEVCAIQWCRCVEKSLEQLSSMDPSRVHSIRYEDFVTIPEDELQALIGFLGIHLSPGEVKSLVRGVTSKSVGNWKRAFSERDLEVLETLISAPMRRLGYHGIV